MHGLGEMDGGASSLLSISLFSERMMTYTSCPPEMEWWNCKISAG